MTAPTAGADHLDGPAIRARIDADGHALIGQVLTTAQCDELVRLLDQPDRFRATVDMARHRLGSGEYRYFAHPLPEPVRALRASLYRLLRPVAVDWARRLGRPAPWPGHPRNGLHRRRVPARRTAAARPVPRDRPYPGARARPGLHHP